MRYFLCIILPPLAVLTTGRVGAFILSIILTICFWIPGVIHAILIVSNYNADKRNEKLIRATREAAKN